MGIAYRTLKGDEIRLLAISPQDSHAGDDRVHCTIKYVSLSKSELERGSESQSGRINFRGEVKDECPEYLTVMTEIDVDAMSTMRTLGHIAKGLARRSIGRESSSLNPLANPERFAFSLQEGRPSMRDWEPPEYASAAYPKHSPTRYRWGDFVALSYMWGTGSGQIVVDGREPTVTANLEAALREIRAKGWFNGHQGDSNLMLWVDALCINQEDKEEQAAQVMRMGQIYREAGNVLVWLKDDEPYGHMHGSEITSDLAIQYMQWLSAYYRTEVLEAVDHSSNAVQVHQFREVASIKLKASLRMVLGGIIADDIDIDDLGWFAIFHFVSNPYWRRLWIIQELAMGGHAMPILCRGRVTQWRHIRDSALIAAQVSGLLADRVKRFAKLNSLRAPDLSGDLPIDHLAAIGELAIHGQRKAIPYVQREMLQFSSRPGPEATPALRGTRLLQILALASHAHCSMPEDRVWGLLEVPRIRTLAMRKATGMRLENVYREFAVRCIESGDRPTELEAALEDEVMNRVEDTTVTMHGMVVGAYRDEQTITAGVTYSLDIFAYVNGFETELQLPSWVPDLSAPPALRTHALLGPWCAGGRAQSVHRPNILVSTGDDNTDLTKAENPVASLKLHAVLLDEIISVGAIQQQVAKQLSFTSFTHFTVVHSAEAPSTDYRNAPEEGKPRGVFHQGVVQDQTSPKDLAKSEDDAAYSLARVLVAGADVNGGSINTRGFFDVIPTEVSADEAEDTIDSTVADFITSSADFRVAGRPLRSYFATPPATATADDAAPDIEHLRLKQSMAAKVRGRRLAITKVNGALCLVPMATQPGDLIWTVVGHRRPVVLRKLWDLSPSAGYYRLIGEAFVDGIMDGEAADMGLMSRWGTVILI